MGSSSASPGPVALVGFMGSGKSDVGRALGHLLDLPFIDCDELIVANSGPIPGIMAEAGEAGFREIERGITVEALAHAHDAPCVIALGGGAVLSGDVREALQRLPHVAWLTAPVRVMWERVRRAGLSERPLARDEAGFAGLYEGRVPLYEEVATLTVANDGSATADQVAAEIVVRLAVSGRVRLSGAGEESGS